MRIHAIHWSMLALAGTLAAAPVAALAQDAADYASASPPSNPTGDTAPPADGAPGPDDSALIGSALVFDPATLAGNKPAKSPNLPRLADPKGLDVSRTEKPDGSSSVVVKQGLPAEWDAKLGADLGSTSPDSARPYKPLARTDPGGGAAWASLGVSNLATIDARIDPGNDQSKLGTTLKKSIPVGENFSVTLQNTYSVTDTLGPPSAATSDVPLMKAPPPATTPAAPQFWGNEKAAKFDILPTGTTFGASMATTSTDPVTHNTFSAEQKLYGPLHVTTAVTDIGQPTVNKKITAGFKLNW